MSRFVNRTTQNIIDVVVLSLAFWLAFLLRFDWQPTFEMVTRHAFVWPYIVALQFALLVSFGIPRFAWRYVGLREATRIAFSIGTAAIVLLVARVISARSLHIFPHALYALVPIGVIAINSILAYLGVTGVRVVRRMVAEHRERESRALPVTKPTRTILIGAGEAGIIVARELTRRPDLRRLPIAFVDDDVLKVGSIIFGVPVLGTTHDLPRLAKQLRAEEALISIANAPGKAVRDIAMRCKEIGLPAKIIPGIYEIVGGDVNLTRIRNVAIEDLLGRRPVVLDDAGIAKIVTGRTVIVTGAGGSIGSELCRQICKFGPANLLLIERNENALFNIHREIVARFSAVHIVPCIGDVGDEQRMRDIFERFKPEVLFHAAAHKHVPMMEWNPGEALKNNVFGTKLVADLASEYGVDVFIMVSTDKAVNPTSVMGATKRLAEIYLQALSQKSNTKYVMVRFGNVLGSAGSVIPIFKEQIERGGPVTVTHADMKRYFMTIPEACQLVLQAASMGEGGEIFVLDMGEPVRIIDLARDLIRLSGFNPDEDIEIRVTGMRPGEKLFEELSLDDEQADKTKHPKIFIGRVAPQDWATVMHRLSELRQVMTSNDAGVVRAKLADAIPEYQGHTISEPEYPEPVPIRKVMN